MYETSKSVFAKLKDNRYVTRYLVGEGIDIGSGSDSLAQYAEFFPLMTSVRSWDLPDGDAQYMQGIPDNHYDFVHSSHCLEHMHDQKVALDNWIRIVKPNGYLVLIVPDEDLYEHGKFPSAHNSDHKATFTIFKKISTSSHSINLIDLFKDISGDVQILKMELCDGTYRYKQDKLWGKQALIDQTTTPIGECSIEIVLKKIDYSALNGGSNP